MCSSLSRRSRYFRLMATEDIEEDCNHEEFRLKHWGSNYFRLAALLCGGQALLQMNYSKAIQQRLAQGFQKPSNQHQHRKFQSWILNLESMQCISQWLSCTKECCFKKNNFSKRPHCQEQSIVTELALNINIKSFTWKMRNKTKPSTIRLPCCQVPESRHWHVDLRVDITKCRSPDTGTWTLPEFPDMGLP